MPTRLAIEKLQRDLMTMGEMGEHILATAVMALVDRDADLAYYVIDYDNEMDEMELGLDRQCIDLMQGGALSGADLRFVAAAAKINNDIERVGDLAAGICEHVLFLVRERSVIAQIFDFQDLLEQVGMMMRESVQALVDRDITLAWKIIDERRIVDDEAHIIFREILDIMKRDPRTIERCCHILEILHLLHRVADQATNIAEEVIFMAEGVVVRHHIREFHPVSPKPFGDVGRTEEEEIESALGATMKPRDVVREEHAKAKRKTRLISRDDLATAAAAAAPKADQAREKLLRLRNGKKNA